MNRQPLNKKLVMLLSIAAVLAGIFIALGPFKSHATAIELVLFFYVLCVWVWRVMLSTIVALALWQYVVPAIGFIGFGVLVTGIALGIFWHLRHRKALRKKKNFLRLAPGRPLELTGLMPASGLNPPYEFGFVRNHNKRLIDLLTTQVFCELSTH